MVAMSADRQLSNNTAALSPASGALASLDPAEVELIATAREALTQPGAYLLLSEDGVLRVVALTADWTRIGRSTSADVRFDDPTVSRRHALIIREAEELTLVDDSSLNGIFVDGKRIERYRLTDGDSFLIGRYRMNFVCVTSGLADTLAAPSDSSPL